MSHRLLSAEAASPMRASPFGARAVVPSPARPPVVGLGAFLVLAVGVGVVIFGATFYAFAAFGG